MRVGPSSLKARHYPSTRATATRAATRDLPTPGYPPTFAPTHLPRRYPASLASGGKPALCTRLIPTEFGGGLMSPDLPGSTQTPPQTTTQHTQQRHNRTTRRCGSLARAATASHRRRRRRRARPIRRWLRRRRARALCVLVFPSFGARCCVAVDCN